MQRMRSFCFRSFVAAVIVLLVCGCDRIVTMRPVLNEDNADFINLAGYYLEFSEFDSDMVAGAYRATNVGAMQGGEPSKAWLVEGIGGTDTAIEYRLLVYAKHLENGRYVIQGTQLDPDSGEIGLDQGLSLLGIATLYRGGEIEIEKPDSDLLGSYVSTELRRSVRGGSRVVDDRTLTFDEIAAVRSPDEIMASVAALNPPGRSQFVRRQSLVVPTDDEALVSAYWQRMHRLDREFQSQLEAVVAEEVEHIILGSRMVLDRGFGILGFVDAVPIEIRDAAPRVRVSLESGTQSWVHPRQLLPQSRATEMRLEAAGNVLNGILTQ